MCSCQGGFGIIYRVKAILSKFILLVLPALVGGCFSLETAPLRATVARDASVGSPVSHVVVANNGWYLFNAWPLACGNARDGDLGCAFFRNDVDIDLLHGRLTRYASTHGCDVTELNVFNDEQVLLSIPGLTIPIPYIITFREMQLSGVLTKRPAGGAQ